MHQHGKAPRRENGGIEKGDELYIYPSIGRLKIIVITREGGSQNLRQVSIKARGTTPPPPPRAAGSQRPTSHLLEKKKHEKRPSKKTPLKYPSVKTHNAYNTTKGQCPQHDGASSSAASMPQTKPNSVCVREAFYHYSHASPTTYDISRMRQANRVQTNKKRGAVKQRKRGTARSTPPHASRGL